MNNAGDYALDLNHKGVHVKFPPANTTSLIQPLDQGITFAFKMLYTWKSPPTLCGCNQFKQEFQVKEVQVSLQDCNVPVSHSCCSYIYERHMVVNSVVKQAKVLGSNGFDSITSSMLTLKL